MFDALAQDEVATLVSTRALDACVPDTKLSDNIARYSKTS